MSAWPGRQHLHAECVSQHCVGVDLSSSLTLWCPLLPYGLGTAIGLKHPVPDRVKSSFVIFWHPGTLMLRADRQSARMSKITNDGLTRPVWHRLLYNNGGRQRVKMKPNISPPSAASHGRTSAAHISQQTRDAVLRCVAERLFVRPPAHAVDRPSTPASQSFYITASHISTCILCCHKPIKYDLTVCRSEVPQEIRNLWIHMFDMKAGNCQWS